MSYFTPETQAELTQWITEQVKSRHKIHWLNPLGSSNSPNLNLSGLKRIIDYPYRDMTITIETGMTVSELQAELLKHNQWLPVNTPSPDKTTIAEVICNNWYGSFSAGYGTMRDWLLGITAIDGRGRTFHAGGRVVKNVAGYDLCKLLVGSDGTLAIPLEATLQVKPQPQQILVHRFNAQTIDSLNKLWQNLRELPFNPVIFDVIHEASPSQTTNVADCLSLVFAVEGSEETINSLTKLIKETASQIDDTTLINIEPWIPSQDPWNFIEGLPQPSTVLRLGCLASQTIDVLNIASKHHFSGFGHASRGAVILRSLADTEDSSTQQSKLLDELAHLTVNSQCLSSSEADKEAAKPLQEKLRLEFDPHQLFASN
ncbi:MAG: FAD-binding protein [Planctomycetaceae bacterium]|nr:FAD-binding protein [Planctomycetaceae bacterium]